MRRVHGLLPRACSQPSYRIPEGADAGAAVSYRQNSPPTASDALLEVYEDATDRAVVYAERAGGHWASSIDPGDDGRILDPLSDALDEKTSDLLLFGSGAIDEHPAIHLVAASLTLAEHVGPGARVMPRHRSTPSKDWNVPEAIRALPLLPSIESA